MPRRVTIADIAEATGVSTASVSYALNDRPGVSEETRGRIRQVADELGWRPNRAARALVNQRSTSVALVLRRIPDTLALDPFWPALLAGIERRLSAAGHVLLLRMVDDDDEVEESVYRDLAQSGCAGFVLTDLRDDDPRCALVEELEIPAVALGRARQSPGVAAVELDDRPGIRACVRHLLDLGHRRIAHVAGRPGMVHARSREQALRAELATAGLEPVEVVSGDFTAQGGADATKRLVSGDGPMPTAIVYANDLMATSGMALLADVGLSVPGDISVTGYDDAPLSAHLSPALTTVATDVVAWGEAAADALLRGIDAGPVPPTTMPPPRMVVRASTGPAPDERELDATEPEVT